jgi:protein MpaA
MYKSLIVILILSGIYACTNIRPLSEKGEAPTTPNSKLQKGNQKVSNKADSKKEFETNTFKNSTKVLNYCDKIDKYFKKYKWGKSGCKDYSWHHVRSSHFGNPIVWFSFGDEAKKNEKPKNTTMIFCGVHGDEITPIKFCFDILKDLKKNPDIIGDNSVIIAPIVSPDSFFKKYPTRTNGRGIDVNRNFPTKDWNKSAKKIWTHRYRKDKRRNPGETAASEQETIFQVNLIKRYNPNKIISVHSPLTLIDYDGPEEKHGEGSLGQQLLIQMSHKAGKYRINNYPFFPGSLGNWAGNERKIPTYTLELPNSDWTKTKKFYKTFRLAIHHAIDHNLTVKDSDKKITDNKKPENSENDKVL